jgi:hypothetical protein
MRERIDEPHFLLAEPGKLRVSYDFAQPHVIARKESPKKCYVIPIGYASPWIDPQRPHFREGAAVNLAAFGGAFGSLVAAVRGICNLNSLPR